MYEKAFREAEKAQEAYKKADADVNMSRADVEKVISRFLSLLSACLRLTLILSCVLSLCVNECFWAPLCFLVQLASTLLGVMNIHGLQMAIGGDAGSDGSVSFFHWFMASERCKNGSLCVCLASVPCCRQRTG